MMSESVVAAKTASLIDLIDLDRNPPHNYDHPHLQTSNSNIASDQSTDHRSPTSSLFSLSLSSPTFSSSSSTSTLVSSISTTASSSSPAAAAAARNTSPLTRSNPSSNSFKSTLWIPFYHLFSSLWSFIYSIIQDIIILLFAHPVPSSNVHPSSSSPLDQPIGRVAIIGAGITGISSAAHFLSNRFEVIIFEQSDSIGGIWSKVNSTSSLQLDSLMYRFHPSVKWSHSFPVKKAEILGQLQKIWNSYQLNSRTRFNVTVERVSRQKNFDGGPSKWIINDGAEGVFDAIIVAVGTCGPPERVAFKGRDTFNGTMVHSSELDQVDWNAKRVVVLGGGASAVEALELAVQSGCTTPAVLVTRTDKWFIPRNIIAGTFLAMNPLGIPSILDKIAEKFVRTFHYGSDLEWMSPAAYNGQPATRLYSKTPIVNGEFLNLVRQRRANYVRAKINRILPGGIEIQSFSSEEPEVIPADVIVEATGYKRPSLDFLPAQKLFQGAKTPDQYAPPNLFLQNFVPNDWSCLMTNAGYFEGIGTVGHNHIGILSRILMMFIVDPKTAPSHTEMREWVDRITAHRGSLHFYTYSELSTWLTVFLLSSPRRWPWLVFVGTGWGALGSQKIKAL